ncbi:hypothetical protein B0H19DRAFT_1323887 [Mycena capillaripes]|nr:hypothetical protein B0H19DRAFT_1323887 [Mycena capillaripes]
MEMRVQPKRVGSPVHENEVRRPPQPSQNRFGINSTKKGRNPCASLLSLDVVTATGAASVVQGICNAQMGASAGNILPPPSMDDEHQSDPEFTKEPNLDGPDRTTDQYTGAFFNGAKDVVIAGGKFKSVTHIHHTTSSDPPGHPRESGLGDGAEELAELIDPVAVIQIFSNLWYNLILWTELREKYRNYHFSTAFFWACMYRSEYMVWIRSSTGHLCIELTPPESVAASLIRVGGHFRPSGTSLLDPPEASETINSMSLQHYHSICYWHLNRSYHLLISTNISVNLGTIRHFSGPEYESSFEIAFTTDWIRVSRIFGIRMFNTANVPYRIFMFPLRIDYSEEGPRFCGMAGFDACFPLRYHSLLIMQCKFCNVEDEYQRQIFSDDSRSWSWLAQANHIFNSLDIKSNFEDYVFVERTRYSLKFSGANFLPPGYLFLCPLVERETEVPGCLGIPDCPAYWSLDPSGAERLSPEKASNVGFPEIELCTQVYGRSWDSSVHAGIRQFHEAKCFDPYDQEVALELGVPLFQVSCEQDALCARCKPRFRIMVQSSDGLPVQRNSAGDDYSDSDRTSNRDDFSESWCFENDAQDAEIDARFCGAKEQDNGTERQDPFQFQLMKVPMKFMIDTSRGGGNASAIQELEYYYLQSGERGRRTSRGNSAMIASGRYAELPIRTMREVEGMRSFATSSMVEK